MPTLPAQDSLSAQDAEPNSSNAVSSPSTTDSPSAESPRNVGRRAETILVVEDDDEVRRLAEVILRREGYDIRTAMDATEALEMTDAELQEIDLLVADVAIPGLNGPALAERLAQRAPGLRVLFMSAWLDPLKQLQSSLKKEPFLSKPFGYRELVGKVEGILKRA